MGLTFRRSSLSRRASSFASAFAIFHASITEIRVFPGDVLALISFNETSHLPPEMIYERELLICRL